MIIIISLIALAGTLAYFKLFKHEKKIKRQGRQDMAEDPFDCTEITEYPTYHRNRK